MKSCYLQKHGQTCVMLGEVSQTEKDKHCIISLIHGIQRTKPMNKHKIATEL